MNFEYKKASNFLDYIKQKTTIVGHLKNRDSQFEFSQNQGSTFGADSLSAHSARVSSLQTLSPL